MRGQFVAGLISSGAGLLLWSALAAVTVKRNHPAAQRRAAARFARERGLMLPPGMVSLVAARIRRRRVATCLAMAPMTAAYAFWFGYHAQAYLASADTAPHDRAMPVAGGVPFPLLTLPAVSVYFALLAVGVVIGHGYDIVRARATGPRLAHLREVRLRDAVPPVTTWAVRLLSLFPAVAAVGILAAPTRGALHHMIHARQWAYPVAAVGAVAITAAVERWQLSILRGRQRAATPQQLAFDDAFRVQAVLDLPMLAVGPAYIASVVLLSPLFAAGPVSSYVKALYAIWLAAAVACWMVVVFVTQLPYPRRYYKNRYLAGPPGPAGRPSPAAGRSTAC